MTLLSDLPWIHLQREGVLDAGTGNSTRQWYALSEDPEELERAVQDVSASHVVLVMPDIRPHRIAARFSPDPVLMASGRVLLWPAENDMTGDEVPTRGLLVVPSQVLRQNARAIVGDPALGPPGPRLVVPRRAATWMCGSSAEAAFRTGFEMMQGIAPALGAFWAGLGADRPNGMWWGVGACRGLLGGDVESAWAEEKSGAGDEPSLSQRWHETARRVRVERALPVHPLSAGAAAAIREMRRELVSADLWDRFVAQLAELGPSAARLAGAYRLARATIWGSSDAGTSEP